MHKINRLTVVRRWNFGW